MKPTFSEQAFSRRRLLKMGLATTAAGVLANGLEFALPTEARAQDLSNPDAALAELMEGNKRFVANRLTAYQHDLDILKQHTVDKQEPFAAVLSCADSRVPVEIVFDQPIGHIFLCDPRRRKSVDARNHRQSRIRCRRTRDEGDPRIGSLQLWRGEGCDSGQGGTGSDQFPVSAHPAGD